MNLSARFSFRLKQSTLKILFPLLFSLPLISCATSRAETAFSPVYVTNTSKYAILQPVAMEGSVDGIQRMNASFGEQSFDFDVYVISDSTQLSMTILNEFGTTLGSLFYDGAHLEFDSAVFPKKLKAEYIVADFQFCLYNAEELKPTLAKIGVDFEVSGEKETGGTFTEKRILRKDGKIIAKITKNYKNEDDAASDGKKLNSIHYENLLRGYAYSLTGVEE